MPLLPRPATAPTVRAPLRTPLLAALVAVLGGLLVAVPAAPTASADPAPPLGGIVPPARTSIALTTPLGRFGSPNQHETRPALSEVKLYMADWVLNRGDGSAHDRWLAERMIRGSDDAAALALWSKYGPVTVSSPAAHYGLTATRPGATWGTSRTSARDITAFLDAKRTGDPGSPILAWMRDADPVAADGTRQDWGTSRYSGVEGSKWGWNDYGPSVVASASFGRDFSIAAITYGTAAQQDADLAWSVADTPPAPATLSSGGLPAATIPATPLPGGSAELPAVELPAVELPAVQLPAFEPPAFEVPQLAVPDLLAGAGSSW